jgi:hypothetical protein
MKDLNANRENLRAVSEECDLIGQLATDLRKRELFYECAVDLRAPWRLELKP